MAEGPISRTRPRTPEFAARDLRGVLGAVLELGKARLSALVVVTAAVGYVLGSPGPLRWGPLVVTIVGVGLAALGANALNEWVEVARDARMRRTCGRPLPTRRLSRRTAVRVGVGLGLAGAALLAGFVNLISGGLALATLAIYVLLYTPLKVRTPTNTLVGAVVGALPPLIGWTAAAGEFGIGGWLLAGVLFTWQIPHFLALAWMYREDYERGGFQMLPAVDPDGARTGLFVVLYSLLLVPVSLALSVVGVAGHVYAAGALVLGLGLVALGVRLERQRTQQAARRVFFASIIYLPLLLGLLVVDRRPPAAAEAWTRRPPVNPAVRVRPEEPPGGRS